MSVSKKSLSHKKIKFFTILAFLFVLNFLQGTMYGEESIEEKFISFFLQGENQLRNGHFDMALESFETSLSLAKIGGNETGEVECYKNIGLILWNLGHLDRSKEFYARAQIFAEKYGIYNSRKEYSGYNKIFQLYDEGKKSRALNNYRESIVNFQKAVDLASTIQSKHHELKCLRQLSLSYWELNDLATFYMLNKKCLKIARDLNHKREIGRAYNNIGLYYWKTNEYSKALSVYQSALNIARELNDKVEISACFNNIGVIFKELGSYTKALAYIEKAIRIDEELNNKLYLSVELNNLGTISHRKALFSGLNK